MSFYCKNARFCRCPDCPDAEYYRNQYRIDRCGRSLPRTIPLIEQDAQPSGTFISVNAFAYSLTAQTIAVGDNVGNFVIGVENNAEIGADGIVLGIGGRYEVEFAVYSVGGGTISVNLDGNDVSGGIFSGSELIMGKVVFFTQSGGVLSLVNRGTTNIQTISPSILNNVATITVRKIG